MAPLGVAEGLACLTEALGTMSNLFVHLARRDYASRCLDLIKMKSMVPLDVEEKRNGYKGRIVEVVFDPLRIAEVNGRFKGDGYVIPDDDDDAGSKVIAVCEDGSILFWGGLNSIYHLRKGERIEGVFGNLAFEDIGGLVHPLKMKHTKGEIEGMVEALKKKYTPGK